MRSSGHSSPRKRRGGQIPAELEAGEPEGPSFDAFLRDLRRRRQERQDGGGGSATSQLPARPGSLARPTQSTVGPATASATASSTASAPCAECGGTGWVIRADGGAGRAVLCECRKEERGARLAAAANIPEKYQKCRLDQFKTHHTDRGISQALAAALETCRRYVDNFFDTERRSFATSGLLFTGPPGGGKTHLAVATLLEVIESYQVRGYFVDFTTLLKTIQMTWDDPDAESLAEITRPVLEAELLVLDELGVQKPTDWVMQNLYWVINTRYSRRLPTLFTTNYRLDLPGEKAPPRVASPLDGAAVMEKYERPLAERPEMLSHRISPPLLSRLYEMAQLVNLNSAQDHRREVMAHRRRRGA